MLAQGRLRRERGSDGAGATGRLPWRGPSTMGKMLRIPSFDPNIRRSDDERNLRTGFLWL